MARVSVLVVDDHAVFADALRAVLESDRELHPVAAAYGTQDAIAQVASQQPDVVLVDLDLHEGNGLEFVKRIHALSPRSRVVVLAPVDSPDLIVNALVTGVRVWLPTSVEPRELVRAVHLAHEGGALLPPEALAPVIDGLLSKASITAGPLARLSHRELEILEGLAAGKSRSTLATELHLSVNTVRSHVQNIISKLRVHTTLEAVALYNRTPHS